TSEQVAKISPIIDKTAVQLRDIQRETGRRVHETMAETHRQMAANLTDEQRQKLQQIEERHRRWRHGRFHEPPAEMPSSTPEVGTPRRPRYASMISRISRGPR